MLPELSNNPRPILLHVLPEFEAGAPFALIVDLASKLKEYYHILLTNSRPDTQNKGNELCAKMGVDVRYTDTPQIHRSDIESCRPDVLVLYDVRSEDLAETPDTAPTIYYAHYRYDEEVGHICDAHVEGSPGICRSVSPVMVFPPYVAHDMVTKAAGKPHPPSTKRLVAILSGRPASFDFEYAAAVINGVDLRRVAFIAPSYVGHHKGFDEALQRARSKDSILLCPHQPGSTTCAVYKQTQMLLSLGCFRIDAECGVLRRPVIQKPDTHEEATETIQESLTNRRLIDEMIDYGRGLAARRQLSLHLHEFSNLVRRLY